MPFDFLTTLLSQAAQTAQVTALGHLSSQQSGKRHIIYVIRGDGGGSEEGMPRGV